MSEIQPSDPAFLIAREKVIEEYLRDTSRAILMVDHKLKIIAASDPWRIAFNLPDEETLKGDSFFELFPDFRKAIRLRYLRCLGGIPMNGEHRSVCRKTNEPHWIHWEVIPWRYGDQSIGGLLIIINELMTQENKINELEVALTGGEVGIWKQDLITNRITWSPETEKMWGFKPGEFDGTSETFFEHVHPDERRGLRQAIQRAITGKTSFAREFKILWKDGSIHWIRARAKCETDDQGNPLKLIGASVDITRLNHTQAELKKQHDELNSLMSILRDSEEITQSGTWSLTLGNMTGLWSHGMYRIFGLVDSDPPPPVDEFLKKFVHPDDLPVVNQMFSKVEDGGETWEIKHRIIRVDGSVRCVRSAGKVLRDRPGATARMIGVTVDITEQEKLTSDYQELLADLEQKVELRTHELQITTEAKTHFLAKMSHEIRNPLNSVTILSNLLSQQGLKESDRINFVKRINTAIKTVTEILDEVLDYSRMDAGQIVLNQESFDLNSLLSDLRSLFDQSAEDKGLEFKILQNHSDLEVVGDEKRLRQILINLIGNAIKFTDSGHVTVTTESLFHAPDHIVIRFNIVDTGIGIETGSLATIFNPFTQADHGVTRRYGGSGLGLTITKSLVELMGGRIEVQSTPGLGSRFSFFVRLKINKGAFGSKKSHSNRTLAGCPILIVDDDASNLDSMRTLLTSFGAVVQTEESGQAAIDFLSDHENPCNAVLMDIQMPGMDGITATKVIRNKLHRDAMPIIAITGGLMPEQQKEALEAGITALIRKPVLGEEVIRRLLSHCSEDCKKNCIATRQ